MNKMYCFIKNQADNKLYCSKCGSSVLQDEYNMKIHALKCSPQDIFMIRKLKENRDVFYSLECAEPGILHFKVVTPSLALRPGFHDRFSGGTWKTLFEVAFHENSRDVESIYGNSESLLAWIWALEQKRLIPIHTKDDISIIHTAFPAIQDIYDYRMFLYLYQTRGFARRYLISTGDEENYFSLSVPEVLPSSANGYSSLYIDTHLHYIQEDMVLEFLILNRKYNKPIRGLVSRDYFYTTEPIALSTYFYLFGKPQDGVEKDVFEFNARYPEFGLASYWQNGGRNILLPLFSGTYHKAIELFAKSGCIAAAEYKNMEELSKDPYSYSNVKDIMGLPVSIIRKIGKNLRSYHGFFETLKSVFIEKRRFLEFPAYSSPMLECLRRNISLEDGNIEYSGWFELLGDNQIFHVLKYLCSEEYASDSYQLYHDYIRCCSLIGNYVYGLTPKNIKEAHDNAVKMVAESGDQWRTSSFIKQVTEDHYIGLTTECPEDYPQFEDDNYVIIAPTCPHDLVEESNNMHHCVRIYTDAVISGSTKIFFLRQKSDIGSSYGTIEIKNNCLIQAKAKYNRKLSSDAQKFLCKWAAIKHLSIQTSDINDSVAKQYAASDMAQQRDTA